MSWSNNNHKLSYLHYFQNLGFECSFIEGNDDDMNSYKNPSDEVVNIAEHYLEKYTGIGVHLGKNNEFRAIDIDDFHIQVRDGSDSTHSRLSRVSESFFIKKCMDLLGLPEDYEWLIRTPHGWHIVISAPFFGFEKAAYCAKEELMPNVISGNVIHFKTIELLWDGFLVMPPSKYGKYKGYRFYNQQPNKRPIRVGAAQILEFLCYYCGEYKFITDLTDYNSIPIIGDAHLFPHYTLNCDHGSQYYDENEVVEDLSKNREFLRNCRSSLGFNMQGFQIVYNDLINDSKVEKGLDLAIKCFRMANDEWGHFNLACLMAIGAMDGSVEELYKHLDHSKGISDEYKDQLKILFLAKNHSYEEYAIIDIVTNENQRIEKVAILIVDVKGNILDKRFLSFDSVMLQNMYYALERADYLVGCDLSAIEEVIRKECEISGYGFSEDMIGFSSAEGEYTVHNEGNYLDAFRRPWINLSSLEIHENDPFHRVYKIKEAMVHKLNRHENF